MRLWGKDWSRLDLLDRIGRLSQVGGLTPFEFDSGKARGVRGVRVQTGGGLDFSVLIDKGLDIFDASYFSKSLCWHSPVGVVHPAYYDGRDLQWLKSFPGGLVSTCGLSSAGGPSEDQGEAFGLHGSIGNTPADTLVLSEDWEGDECKLRVAGTVRETRVHGQNLFLRRRIETYIGSRTVILCDTVGNDGFREAPLMLLYHLNFGFPFLTDRSAVSAPTRRTQARNAYSEQTIESWANFEGPTAGVEERVYYHDMKIDSSGNVNVVLVADRDTADLGVSIRYGGKNLPCFIQWKMTGANHFALGLEPANCLVEGRAAERARGTLQMLRPGEQREFTIAIGILDGRDEVRDSITATT
jgi:Domain of unknown function (DUF4432)